MKRLLFYSDAVSVGGHELQCLNIISSIDRIYDIHFVVYQGNQAFISLLEKYNITIIAQDYFSRRLQVIRSPLSLLHIRYLSKIIKQIKPELIVNVQGNIEIGSIMLLAAKINNISLVTYIPATYALRKVSKSHRVISILKDFINQFYFSLPSTYLTINEFNRQNLLARGISCPIEIIHNAVNFPIYTAHERSTSRQSLGLKEGEYCVLLIGRIELNNKGHDILASMVDKYQDDLSGVKFLIIGDGTDKLAFKEWVSVRNLTALFIFYDHQTDLSKFYSAADMVTIPSIYESGYGTPLVLLEALHYRLPVLMSRLPEMECYLPDSNLFKVADIDDYYHKMRYLIDKGRNESENSLLDVHDVHSLDRFKARAIKVFSRLTSNGPD